MRHWRILDMHGKTSATAGGICFSWTTNGGNGAWTSWPPHEHEKDLEEVYCYFDMDDPHFGLHLSYVEPGDTHGVVAHTVKSGTMILAPRGYHPTVAAREPEIHIYGYWQHIPTRVVVMTWQFWTRSVQK